MHKGEVAAYQRAFPEAEALPDGQPLHERSTTRFAQ
jgi:hypothetical protein